MPDELPGNQDGLALLSSAVSTAVDRRFSRAHVAAMNQGVVRPAERATAVSMATSRVARTRIVTDSSRRGARPWDPRSPPGAPEGTRRTMPPGGAGEER